MANHQKYLLQNTPDAQQQLIHIKTLLQSKQSSNLYLAFELLRGGGLPNDPHLHQLMSNNKLAINLCLKHQFYGVITQLHIFENNDWINHLDQFYNLQKLLLENQIQGRKRLQYPLIFEKLSRLPSLQELRIWNHPLHHLPVSIQKLTRLKKLDLYLDCLVLLPKEIARLTNLENLRMHSNRLIGLPSEISLLANLQILDLTDNHLRSLPETFYQLQQLHTLCLKENRFTRIPSQLLELPQLKHLDLTANPIRKFSSELEQMQQLEKFGYRRRTSHYVSGRNFST